MLSLLSSRWLQRALSSARGIASKAPTPSVYLSTSALIPYPALKSGLAQFGEVASLWQRLNNHAADRLVAQNGFVIDGENVNVMPKNYMANDYTEKPPPKVFTRATNLLKNTRLCLDNVPTDYGANAQMLVDLLRPFQVLSVEMPTSKKRYGRRAYAEFVTQDAADATLEQIWSDEGLKLFGRRIYANYAAPPLHAPGDGWVKVAAMSQAAHHKILFNEIPISLDRLGTIVAT
ncbi:hypothetical protein BDZ89DRAFT_1068958 [Hymenopellis radicata]|nr:hypothetical protein BDZ89DRAFT_1068958 [Hymenopellis radicata]